MPLGFCLNCGLFSLLVFIHLACSLFLVKAYNKSKINRSTSLCSTDLGLEIGFVFSTSSFLSRIVCMCACFVTVTFVNVLSQNINYLFLMSID